VEEEVEEEQKAPSCSREDKTVSSNNGKCRREKMRTVVL